MAVRRWPTVPLPALDVITEDLRLRPWRTADAERLASAWEDDELTRWLDPPAGGVEAARRWIAGCASRASAGQSVDAVIEVAGDVAGEVGFHGFDQTRRAALVGYWVGPTHRGHGLASRALRAATAWFFDAMNGEVVLAECARENVASWRTAEQAGYRRLAGDGEDQVMVQLREGHGAT